MARYIDADKATEEARLSYCKDCNSYNGVMCRACAFDDAMSFIDDFPEADVAPRADVAREIFEEIDTMIFGTIIPNDCAIISIAKLAELKKKYTEARND